jgi:hypothetical protein
LLIVFFSTDLLRPFLIDPSRPPNVLELFARTTLSGLAFSPLDGGVCVGGVDEEKQRRGTFLAVGNEAVKFNVLDEAKRGRKGWLRVAE